MSRLYFLLLLLPLTGVFWPVEGNAESDFFGLQVSAFKEQDRAVQDVDRLKSKGFEAFFRPEEVPGKGIWHRVYIGRFPSKGQALEQAQTLKTTGVISDYMIRRLHWSPAINTEVTPNIVSSGSVHEKQAAPGPSPIKKEVKDELLVGFQTEPEPPNSTQLVMRPIPDLAVKKVESPPAYQSIKRIERKIGDGSPQSDPNMNAPKNTFVVPKRESAPTGFPGERQPMTEWDVSGQQSNRIAVKKIATPPEVPAKSKDRGPNSVPVPVKKGEKQDKTTGPEQPGALDEAGPATPMTNSRTIIRTYVKGTDDIPDPTSSDSFADEKENESSVGFSLVTTF